MKGAGALIALRHRLGGPVPVLLEESAESLCHSLRAILVRASKHEWMTCGAAVVNSNVFVTSPPDKITKNFPEARAVVAGSKDRNRPVLIRADGAWIHFTLSVLQQPNTALQLIAYDFEVCFPSEHRPEWLRFDLNPPRHGNADRGMRSHMHPGHRDIQIASPAMSPQEALLVCIHDVAVRDRAKDDRRRRLA